jgi:hypothetical protein
MEKLGMKQLYAIFIVFIISLFSDNAMAFNELNSKENVWAVSAGLGKPKYDNLAKARGHPPNDMANDNGISYWTMDANCNYSIIDMGAGFHGCGGSSSSPDTSFGISSIYLTAKIGIRTLPYSWFIQLIPEIGYFYYGEILSKKLLNSTQYIYKEEVIATGFAPGISGMCEIYSGIVVNAGCFYNNVKKFEINNYYAELRYYPSLKDIPKNTAFFAIEAGMSKKTDGREYSYFGLKVGAIKSFREMKKEQENAKKKAK